MKIYVASSWRNLEQPAVVHALRKTGHLVYDFRNPHPKNDGFRWTEIDPAWQAWPGYAFRAALEHPVAREGFRLDMEALEAAEVTVLVLPCGRSAHLELGYARGLGQRTAVLLGGSWEPELMYRMVDRVVDRIEDLLLWFEEGCPTNGEERYLHAAREALTTADELLCRSAAKELCVCEDVLAVVQSGLVLSRPPLDSPLDDRPRPVFA